MRLIVDQEMPIPDSPPAHFPSGETTTRRKLAQAPFASTESSPTGSRDGSFPTRPGIETDHEERCGQPIYFPEPG